MLSRREIRDIVISTFLASRSPEETGMDDLSFWDDMFTLLHEEGIVLSDKQWSVLSEGLKGGLVAHNQTHPLTKKLSALALRWKRFPSAFIRFMVANSGRIYLYTDELTELLAEHGASGRHEVEQCTLAVMQRARNSYEPVFLDLATDWPALA